MTRECESSIVSSLRECWLVRKVLFNAFNASQLADNEAKREEKFLFSLFHYYCTWIMQFTTVQYCSYPEYRAAASLVSEPHITL